MMEGRAGRPTVDINALRDLKNRMSAKKKSGGASVADSGSSVYDGNYGFGNFSVPVPGGQMSRTSSAPSLHCKREEVEGSRPRVWKPSKAPKAAPGGNPTFHPSKDGQADPVAGRKRFPGMGAGNNRDPNAIEALRYYQDSERLGKQACDQRRPSATDKLARDSHRYYLAAEGKAEITPGKARSSQSTSAGGSEAMISECDSLPLGAEWSSCRFDSVRGCPVNA